VPAEHFTAFPPPSLTLRCPLLPARIALFTSALPGSSDFSVWFVLLWFFVTGHACYCCDLVRGSPVCSGGLTCERGDYLLLPAARIVRLPLANVSWRAADKRRAGLPRRDHLPALPAGMPCADLEERLRNRAGVACPRGAERIVPNAATFMRTFFFGAVCLGCRDISLTAFCLAAALRTGLPADAWRCLRRRGLFVCADDWAIVRFSDLSLKAYIVWSLPFVSAIRGLALPAFPMVCITL